VNRKHSSYLCLSLAALFIAIPGASAQSTFNLAADFSASQNPNGAWSFGWMAASNSVFNLYGTAHDFSLNEWHGPFPNDNDTSPPDVISNPADIPFTVSDTTWLPRQITFHPGPQGERSVIRWTSPFAGPASLAAAFEGRSGFATSGVEIYQNNTLVFSNAVLGTGAASQISFATNLLVQIGDAIDFRVNYGNGDWSSDTTQIGVVIAPALQPQPALTLSTELPDTARLAWPANAPGYGLESATQLPPASWSPVTNAFVFLADHFSVTVSMTNQSQFFRLRKL
jgi:hypothetical protein